MTESKNVFIWKGKRWTVKNCLECQSYSEGICAKHEVYNFPIIMEIIRDYKRSLLSGVIFISLVIPILVSAFFLLGGLSIHYPSLFVMNSVLQFLIAFLLCWIIGSMNEGLDFYKREIKELEAKKKDWEVVK